MLFRLVHLFLSMSNINLLSYCRGSNLQQLHHIDVNYWTLYMINEWFQWNDNKLKKICCIRTIWCASFVSRWLTKVYSSYSFSCYVCCCPPLLIYSFICVIVVMSYGASVYIWIIKTPFNLLSFFPHICLLCLSGGAVYLQQDTGGWDGAGVGGLQHHEK